MEWLPGWKLTYNGLSLIKRSLVYQAGSVTVPQATCGPIAVFRTREAAGAPALIRLHVVAYVRSTSRSLWCYIAQTPDVMSRGFPAGTDFADSVYVLDDGEIIDIPADSCF